MAFRQAFVELDDVTTWFSDVSRTNGLFCLNHATRSKLTRHMKHLTSGSDHLTSGSDPRGCTFSIHDGEVRYIFWGLKIYTLGFFLGQETCHVFL